MTDASKLKKKIRDRAARTGESYAAARRHVVAQVDADRATKTRATAEKAKRAPATGAVSDARCREKTGHGFDHWFEVLDRFGGRTAGHTASARHLQHDQGVSAWYAQAITVAYERAHGLREVNQLCTGDFQTSVSRVLPLGLELARTTLVDQRSDWLDEADGEVATALGGVVGDLAWRPVKGGIRTHYSMGDSRVELELRDRPDGRSSVVVRHTKIVAQDTMAAMRAQWRGTLDRFRDHCRTIA